MSLPPNDLLASLYRDLPFLVVHLTTDGLILHCNPATLALTHYEDRNSMAHSLETRLPFLDHRLVNFAVHLPASMKLRNGWTKYILREAMPELPRHFLRFDSPGVGQAVAEGDFCLCRAEAPIRGTSIATVGRRSTFRSPGQIARRHVEGCV